jgi:hypothetical protein
MSPIDWAGQRQTRRQMRRSLRALQVPVRADEVMALWLPGGNRPSAPAESDQPLVPRGIHNLYG